MPSYKVHGMIYPRIFKKDKELIKYSPAPKEAWLVLQQKNIPFLNTPTKIENLTKEEKQQHPETECKITLPYLTNYETLGHSPNLGTLTTKQLLILIKQITEKIKQMHKENIYHTDIYSENIMINKKELALIDLDAMIIEQFISKENVYQEDKIPFEEKITKSIKDDKLSILSLLLYYLKNGTFKNQMGDYIDLYHLNFPTEIKKELSAYQLQQTTPTKNYYYEDIIEELIKIGYESPNLETRKK